MKLHILFISALLLLSGCGLEFGNGNNDISIDYDKIHSGTEGLLINGVEGAPPNEVFEEQGFSFVAELSNKGAATIYDGKLKLIMDSDYIEAENDEQTFTLEGRSLYAPKGNSLVVDFTLSSKTLPEEMSQTHDSEIVLTACYPYFTELRREVCLDPDYFQLNQGNKEKACIATTVEPKSQGGPLQVSKLEPKFNSKEGMVVPQYIIHVRNAGGGLVVNPDSLDAACSSDPLDKEDWNTAFVTAKLSGEPMKCFPSDDDGAHGKLRFKQGEDFVKCEATQHLNKGEAAYVSWLLVNVTYGYTDSISKPVRILKIV